MKYKRLVTFIENKSGNFYQVQLEQKEMDMVADLISQMHNGKIKVGKGKYPFTIVEPKVED